MKRKRTSFTIAFLAVLLLTGCGGQTSQVQADATLEVAENATEDTGSIEDAEAMEDAEVSENTEESEDNASDEEAVQQENSAVTDSDTNAEAAQLGSAQHIAENLGVGEEVPDAHTITDMAAIIQYPELPTGCESVALTMALNYLGYNLAKTEIAENYLIYDSSNYVTGFVGNPFASSGAGIFTPGLVNTANNFLAAQGDSRQAENISDTTFDQLFQYVASDVPVLIWATMYQRDPIFMNIYVEHNGKVYEWYQLEHCIVLTGYDKSNDTVQLHDPIQGVITVSMSRMRDLYNQTGQNAMVIM